MSLSVANAQVQSCGLGQSQSHAAALSFSRGGTWPENGASHAPKNGVRLLLSILLVAFLTSLANARQIPLNAKEIGLMLRTGYSSEAVMRELEVRHFADTCDEATKKLLTDAGANAALISGLSAGKYAVPPEEIARAQQELAAENKRRAAAAEQSRKFDTLYQHELAQKRVAPAAPQAAGANAIYPLLKGDLVCWRNGTINRFDDEPLEKKKLIAFYFSAHWCGPCRKFTPQLVDYYNRVAAQHPEFEIIFVSYDRSAFGFETYLKDTGMPWPAIDFPKVAAKNSITKYAGSGIPDLELVDETGKVLSSSYVGKEYRGPQQVLTDLDQIFAAGARRVAQGQ
jgi:nucleoredoxin